MSVGYDHIKHLWNQQHTGSTQLKRQIFHTRAAHGNLCGPQLGRPFKKPTAATRLQTGLVYKLVLIMSVGRMFRDVKYEGVRRAEGTYTESSHLICEFILFYQLQLAGKDRWLGCYKHFHSYCWIILIYGCCLYSPWTALFSLWLSFRAERNVQMKRLIFVYFV